MSKKKTEETKPEELKKQEEKKVLVFQYNDQLNEFEELEIEENLPLRELLDPDFILLFVDHEYFRVWIWQGSNTSTRMKFIAAKISPMTRDRYGISYKITTVDDGDETEGFRRLVKMQSEVVKSEEIQTGPAYEGTEEDLELLASLSREKILLLLAKTDVPEGYERKMVIVQNTLYGYKEYDRYYLGSVVKEKQLFPLKEKVPDGNYLAEHYTPRILFSFNNVVLTELLQKIENKNN